MTRSRQLCTASREPLTFSTRLQRGSRQSHSEIGFLCPMCLIMSWSVGIARLGFYSKRKARIGSLRVARRTGMQQAASATNVIKTANST